MIEPDPANPGEDELLAAYLAGRDVQCPACRYNLRDVRGGRCPECGKEIVLGVERRREPYAAFLALFAALSFVAGMFLLNVPWMFSAWAAIDQAYPWWQIALVAYMWTTIPLIVWLIVKRRKFLMLPIHMQWMLASLPIAVVIYYVIEAWYGYFTFDIRF